MPSSNGSTVQPDGVTSPPGAGALLTAWERGLLEPGSRGDALLAAVGAVEQPAGLLPLGRRNRMLLDARRLLFGPVADVVAPCDACGERLEAEVSLPALLGALPSAAVDPAPVRLRGYEVRLRLPTGDDLTDLPGDVEAAARELLARVVLTVSRGGEDVELGSLPPGVLRAADEALAAADPAADLELAVDCPDCGAQATVVLDPVELLWDEVDAWAWRMLGEVHALAGAYGWSEADVLALTPARRQAYLYLSGAGEGGG